MESPLTPGVWYAAAVVRVVDGDTFAAIVDLGGGEHYPTHVRILDVDAPERRRPTLAAGDRSKLGLVELLGAGTVEVRGRGTQLDKYGRVLAEARVTPAAEEGGPPPAPVDVAGQLLAGDYARPRSVA